MNVATTDLLDTSATRSATSPTQAVPVATAPGIEAWHVESPVVPLIALAFTFEGGAAQDPEGKAGVAQMLARLLDEGAGDLSSDAFQERLAARAIELSFHAGSDALGGSLKMLIKHADEAIDLLALALAKPRLDPDAIERVRAQTLAGLRYQQNDPGVMASRRFFAEAYAGHPYARPSSGTPESIAAITRDDLVTMHRQIIGRGGLKVAAVGAIDAARLAESLDRAFGRLALAAPLKAVPQTRMQNIGARHVVDLDVPQSVIRFGMNGVPWRDPDFIPAYVLNHILGGGSFTSRLFQEVREKRGLAYSVGTSLVSHRAASMTWGYTATKNERVGEALSVIGEEIGRLITEGPSDEELQKAKDYLTGSYALGFDTSTKIAHQLVQIAFEGLGMDYIARRNDLVANVTQADIRRAGARTFADGKMLVVAAGRPTDF
ncbi:MULTISPECIES: pitrilysin family protein [unclassified Methylobacterium]|uniref:M16 family metallopeptidase n=1 Tax=unclassified Methylobacterium TaxID=2615210 RepID=UPI0006F8E420|nr:MULTISPECIES: pitrilysin family protein [unclassified Methylobacterium]KQP92705.1 zinc protease [Methylobacterium sp. Leaf113]MCK2053678.1 insulinase family protein [Methylobacterium sp. 37f]